MPTEGRRGRCDCCGKECAITADDVIRFHIAPDNMPECKEGPDSRKCKGAGKRPRGYKQPVVEAGTAGYVCRIPTCGHPVQLTANNRARSHLNTDNPPVRCDGGSDWPIAVAADGTRTDTKPDTTGFVMGHTVDDGAGGHETHDGAVADCMEEQCIQARCTHPGGFQWGDDGNGHSGSVCRDCGMDEDDLTETQAMERRGQQVGAAVAAMDARNVLAGETFPIGAEHDPDTGVPGSALVLGLERAVGDPGTVADRSPAVDRMRSHIKVADLMEGTIFRRHTSKTPDLIYRAKGGSYDASGPVSVIAMVVTPGPYAGREGTLTNLEEVVQCTDLNGRPRPRPQAQGGSTSAPAAVRPTSNGPRPSSPEPSPTTPSPVPGSKPTTPAGAAPAVNATSSPATASAPTAPASTSTRTAPVTDSATQFLAGASGAHGEEEGRYDRYGRYVLLHPTTGAEVHWTRATTFAKSISDTYALSMWSQRMVLKGTTLRPDLVTQAHGKDVAEDKEWMDKATAELKNMAGDKVSANLGTVYHSFTELCDRAADPYAELVRVVPPEAQPDIRAYLDLLAETGLRPVPMLIEWTTGVLQYEVCGTSDRCYQVTKHLELEIPGKVIHLSPGEFVIGDVKTGKDLDYGWGEIAIQLAVYANGLNTLGRWDWGARTWDPEPLAQYAEPGTKVRLDVGIVPHIPVDKSKGKTPALYAVDLESGWNAAVLCERVRSWRKFKKLAGPVRVLGPGARVLQQEAAQQPAAAPAAAPAASTPAAPAATREPTLSDLADAVTTKAEASQVFVRAKAAAVAGEITGDDLKGLVEHMQNRLRVLAEPGG